MKTKQFAIYKDDPLKIKYLVHHINIEENYAILGWKDFPNTEQDYGISLDLIDIIGDNLIQVKDYLLLIDEKAEIKAGNYIYETDTLLINNAGNGYICNDKDFKIIAYYPLTKEAKKLDLPLLPVTPKDKWGVHETHCCEKCGCKYGDNDCCVAIGIAKAKYPCEYCDDDENDKQFSLEDMINAAKYGYEFRDTTSFPEHKFEDSCVNNFKQHIQSLSTQQLPKEFIPEYSIETVWRGFDTIGWKDIKRFKTITNSEGKEELVGTYKY